ncbi:histidine kinase [Vibrio albus]|uniref:Histidine kinase n=1 Tax=Vibrio albus TaxID=2200953 RepID=A0A2U3B983_9VIBR|nr:EAL and HDOD domain-containing protein [Vibrio albus]PWI33342.1 histidine kinase [Vibrio albus]
MYSYVARQPVFNRKQHTVGYELLFRDGENNAFPKGIEENRATYRLIVENFIALGTNPNYHSSRCFINFPYLSIVRLLPLSLPKDKIVIEILETCEPTDELLAAIRHLHSNGYIIALDDFECTESWNRFLPYIHIIKLDVMQMGIEKACDYVRQQKANGLKSAFLAERVETPEEFEAALQAGFRFFQGYFFSKPHIVKQRYVSPDQVIALQLFTEVCRPEVNFNRVERILEKDVALSYKLLRFVNTMSTRLEKPISSFKQALVYLGEDRLKTFVSLIAASYMTNKKTRELNTLSMQRAQFCQLMSGYDIFRPHQDQAFIMGMFSLLDAMLDNKLDVLLESLPLSEIIKSALVKRDGPLGELLTLQESFEQADWQNFSFQCQKLGLQIEDVSNAFSEAQRWSRHVSQVMTTLS